ncbi:hypothetical protein LJR074_003413 [Acidovorax sp. LjRoot74]|uniref:hypothetical protein n=1 Tax=Acidovorax sp. LjRoot74 TaxID=3342337 RepID=UPI003ECE5E8B
MAADKSGTGRILGPVHLTNALLAVVREEGFLHVFQEGTGFDGTEMVLTLRIAINHSQLTKAAALLNEAMEARKTKEAAHG